MAIEELLFDISDALRVPVLVLAVAALGIVLVELGSMIAEILRRRTRSLARLEYAVDTAAKEAKRDPDAAVAALEGVSFSSPMADAMAGVIEQRGEPDGADRIAKRLADYDYRSMRRLERTRILVRMGPALGLMGTLIPLSPALAGLAEGNVTELTDNLRVAFSVTVAGLLVGALAFWVSLVRDRIYAQDYSDVEYVAARLSPGAEEESRKAPSRRRTRPAPANPRS
jgi:biopolymer transport protein ExbB/TolQ